MVRWLRLRSRQTNVGADGINQAPILMQLVTFTSERRPGRGRNQVKTLRVLAGRDLWGNQVGSDQPSAERQRSSSFTRILILIVAANRGTIHSEYVGKTTGPETTLVANRLVERLRSGQKAKINQVLMGAPKFWANM